MFGADHEYQDYLDDLNERPAVDPAADFAAAPDTTPPPGLDPPGGPGSGVPPAVPAGSSGYGPNATFATTDTPDFQPPPVAPVQGQPLVTAPYRSVGEGTLGGAMWDVFQDLLGGALVGYMVAPPAARRGGLGDWGPWVLGGAAGARFAGAFGLGVVALVAQYQRGAR